MYRLKKNKRLLNTRTHIPRRMNLLFFIVFLLFAILIFRLAYLQIVQGEAIAEDVNRTDTIITTGNVPRGEIYDAKHRQLVANQSMPNITYTRGRSVSNSEMAFVANRLARLIDLETTTELDEVQPFDLSIRDLKDYFVASYTDEVNKRLSDEEKAQTGTDFYEIQLDAVTMDDLYKLSEDELVAAHIYKKMSSGYALTTINIKNDQVTPEEIARVNENLSYLPGVNTGADWNRTYPMGDLLRLVLGDVTSEDRGIPEDRSKEYLAKGYARNDRVGISYLEEYYEPVLKGSKSRFYLTTNREGDVVNQVEQYPGSKGSNLVLTIDSAFQATVEEIVERYLREYYQDLNDAIYVAALDPNDGSVLSLVGKVYNPETGEITDDSIGTFNRAFESGSVVKMATVASAYMDGVLDESNQYMIDEPLHLYSTPEISSYYNRDGQDRLNEIEAIEKSSNIYMSKLAMRMGGVWDFENGSVLEMDGQLVIDKLRYYFSQFGLGVPTGIDLPGEQVGYKGQVTTPAQALYYSFGQFDSYTTLQLAQYVATIANGGTRYAPRIVSEVRGTRADGTLGDIQNQVDPVILNRLNLTDQQLSRIHQGMYQVAYGEDGTGRSYMGDTEGYQVGMKTGTAESVYFGSDTSRHGESTSNQSIVAFAPYEDPQIAVAIMIPYLPADEPNYAINQISREILDAYFQAGDYEDIAERVQEEYPVPERPKDRN